MSYTKATDSGARFILAYPFAFHEASIKTFVSFVLALTCEGIPIIINNRLYIFFAILKNIHIISRISL